MEEIEKDWGEGWDYLFEEIWSNLDMIRQDNLESKHDRDNIDHCFSYMFQVCLRDLVKKLKEEQWDMVDKVEVTQKVANLLSLFREARTYNDKVIAINMTEQLIRSIY